MSVLAKAAKIGYKLGRDKRYKRMGAKGATRSLPTSASIVGGMIRQPSSVTVADFRRAAARTSWWNNGYGTSTCFKSNRKRSSMRTTDGNPRFDRMQKKDGIQFHRGLLDPNHLTKWFGPTRGGVLVLDDLMEEGGQDKRVLDLFTKDSHHRNITVLYLTQDLFPPWQILQDDQSQCPLHRGVQKPPGSNGHTNHFTASLSRLLTSSLAPIQTHHVPLAI